ncbi:hypothetical protein NB688_000571 [Xanthomonas sacchari]|uniref:DUF2511 domain-containing protein n=1 Tax=Xanthomonas sacchari TaxID=56458 RepID=A0ABT3DTC5_9XANT|nr:hypothetical protein [Xanthomonas sacchari]MCW0398757.1 hypothetical protein [Xanthomonas sacchari]MCW0418405.1 hypothetical protein [Xanthomonas sacchari]UYK72532.1 hypothetical protein NG828_20485 [Xanthomonas sacchari]
MAYKSSVKHAATQSRNPAKRQGDHMATWRNGRQWKLIVAAIVVAVGSAAAKPELLHVPSDIKAKYLVLSVEGAWPNRIIVTKRSGPSGTSYSKRLYSCSSKRVKYLGTGDTPGQMQSSKPDPNMTTIVPGSIADYVGRRACRK